MKNAVFYCFYGKTHNFTSFLKNAKNIGKIYVFYVFFYIFNLKISKWEKRNWLIIKLKRNFLLPFFYFFIREEHFLKIGSFLDGDSLINGFSKIDLGHKILEISFLKKSNYKNQKNKTDW